jgi:hypothetical protein
MSKKKALDYELKYVGPASKGYVQIDFLDKKGRVMMSSVDVVLNSQYLIKDEDWDQEKLLGFVKTR